MAQQFISNGESGLNSRDAINQNFTELYGAIPTTTKQDGLSGNFNQPILPNTFVSLITIFWVSGGATVKVGTTPNGEEIMGATVIDNSTPYLPLQVQQWFQNSATIYFSFSGSPGVIDARIDLILNYR